MSVCPRCAVKKAAMCPAMAQHLAHFDLGEGGDEEGVTYSSSSSPGNGDDLGSIYQSNAGNDTLLRARVMCYIGTGIVSEGVYSKESWSGVLHYIRTCIRLTHTPIQYF